MENDYLWDKTGGDAEIESLENALKTFRYTETAPPELPQKVFTVEKKRGRKFFQFGLGFAAFAAALIVLSVVWFQTGGEKIPNVEAVAENNASQRPEKDMVEPVVKKPEVLPVVNSDDSPRVVKTNVVKARQTSAFANRPIKAVVRKPKAKVPNETLTAEEKFAYDQLMLALSITGSKLRIVKDKVNGIEERNAVFVKTK